VLRVYRIPFSTNVERVALAAAHKGVEVEWIDVDPADRSPVEAVSGQPLVPVLDDGGEIVADSRAILRRLEERFPEPRLWPAQRAEGDLFLDWFDRVWKRAPNELYAELTKPEPERARVERLGGAITGYLELFEGLLEGRDHLLGEFSVADAAAFPFLKYATDRTPGDDDLFHELLRDWMPIAGRPRLAAWLQRVDARPRA
jgi:glutathione S-transferase